MGFVSWHGTDCPMFIAFHKAVPRGPGGTNVLGQLVIGTVSWAWRYMGCGSCPGSSTSWRPWAGHLASRGLSSSSVTWQWHDRPWAGYGMRQDTQGSLYRGLHSSSFHFKDHGGLLVYLPGRAGALESGFSNLGLAVWPLHILCPLWVSYYKGRGLGQLMISCHYSQSLVA